jgi:ribonuclease Z
MFDLTFLGTSASVPSADRSHPSLLVEAGGHRVMVDCGEATKIFPETRIAADLDRLAI